MKTELTQCDCSRGAPMGRDSHVTEPDAPVKMHLRHMPLNQGYDAGGAYWGEGAPMFHAWSDDTNIRQELFFRAGNLGMWRFSYKGVSVWRETAKAIVRKKFPNARFYR